MVWAPSERGQASLTMKQPRSRRLSLWAVGYIKVAQRETGPQEKKKRAAKTRLISGKRKKSEKEASPPPRGVAF